MSLSKSNKQGNDCIIKYNALILWFLVSILRCVVGQHAPYCPKQCICDEQNLQVICKGSVGAPLSGLPHTLDPKTKRIIINNAQTTQFSSSDLEYFKSIESLDLAHNKLTTIDFDCIKSNVNLSFLNTSHNSITELKDSAITTNVAASIIALKNSAHPTNHQDALKMIKKTKINVVELILSYNQLQVLKNFTFLRWNKLQILDLSYNIISALETESLFGLTKLETLNLRGNQLIQVPTYALQSTAESLSYSIAIDKVSPSLKSLNLAENALITLAPYSFISTEKLQEITLDNCNLKYIENGAFAGLKNLRNLSLNENNLEEFPTGPLSDLSSLKVLRLNLNYFRVIDGESFRSLYNLEDLQMSFGFLHTILPGSLSPLRSLRRLDLAFNTNLTTIGVNVFDELPILTYLNLTDNNLTSISGNYESANHPLKILDLRNNRLICDCVTKWLTKWLKKSNDTSLFEYNEMDDASILTERSNMSHSNPSTRSNLTELLQLTCAGPPALIGRHIIQLPDDKLECMHPNSKLNLKIGMACLFIMMLVMSSICLINFFRSESQLIVIIKENIAQNRLATGSLNFPYSQAIYETNNHDKTIDLECAVYEPIDYGAMPANEELSRNELAQHSHQV